MPVTYATLTARDRDWGLDDFVAEVNRLLPEVVPRDAATRAKLEVNGRLVRHYATEGVLPKPLKEGAEARYDGDHLVRLLALRRLLAEGYPSALAGQFLQRHDRERLARFLLGELQPDLDLAPGGPPVIAASPRPSDAALARLTALRARAGLPPLSEPLVDDPGEADATTMGAAFDDTRAMSLPSAEAQAASVAPPQRVRPEPGATWTRYPLLDGLELHVRDDVVDPTTPAAWNALRDALLARLEAIALERLIRR